MLHLLATLLPALLPAPATLLPALPTRPTAADLNAAKASGDLTLWASSQPRARSVAPYELRMFFKQRSDRDMQLQLGMRSSRDADRTVEAVAAVSVASVVASLGLLNSGGNGGGSDLLNGVGILLALVPFAALAAFVVLPDAVRGLLVRAWRLDPEYRRRQTYHEAGHFLVGYLCGLEVESYDAATGAGASSAVRLGPGADSSRGHEALDALAVVSMAGIAGEVIACGDAEGGAADVAALRDMCIAASPPLANSRVQDERIRWGTLMALTLLQKRRASLDALAAAFEASADVGACVRAIEGASEARK